MTSDCWKRQSATSKKVVIIARYDKYDSQNSGFRAPLAANLTLTNQGIGPIGVSLDANGRVTVGAGIGQSGIVGVLVKNMPSQAMAGSALLPGITSPGALAGDIVDVMVDGEIVDLTGFNAGTVYWADGATGVLAAGQAGGAAPASGVGSTAGSCNIGWTIEATRLRVHLRHA